MSTINITGTGGIIEGNLGAANVNVNLDPVVNFDGTNDYLSASSANFRSADYRGAVSAWIKFTNTSDMTIFSASDAAGSSYFKRVFVENGKISIQHKDSSTIYSLNVNKALNDNSWHHVFVGSTGSSIIMSIDGVAQTVVVASGTNNGDWFNDMTASKLDNVTIGALVQASPATYFNGSIADVRYYSDAVAADAPILASKIQVDDSLTSLQAVHWWKLNSSTIGAGTDELGDDYGSATDIPLTPIGTLTAASIDYDAFSVDVYDGYDGSDATTRTTTNGTFTVTQGKVEGLALTSVAFDGSNDNVDCGSPSSLDDTFNGTASWGFWIRPDSDGQNNFGRVVEKTQWEIYLEDESSGKTRITFNANRGTTAGRWRSERIVDIDKWNHILWVYDGSSTSNDPVLYLNGVAQTLTESSTPNGSITSDASANLRIGNRTGLDRTFDGDIKDVRYYDYLLSAEQAASLYSNTYPQTPNHHWKFDDSIQGTATTTAADSGTETAANGSLDSYTTTTGNVGGGGGSGWQNGTLDLDGTLTIAANGTLSAPRGVINLGGHIYANGNYIHNNGTFAPDVTNINLHDTSTQVWSFYDLDPAARFICGKSINVENELGGASQIRMNGATSTGGATITMGTATSAGNIAVGFFGEWGNNTTTRIVAADTSGINRWTMQSSVNLQLGIASGAFWEFANGDIQIATLITADDYSNAKTITLTGDCEFDAVTVSSGDTLDLNGQRMEVSSTLTNSGTLDFDVSGGKDAMLVCGAEVNAQGTINNKNLGTFVMRNSSNRNFRVIDGTYAGLHIFDNNVGFGSGVADLGTTPITVAGDQSNDFVNNFTCGNLTIPTGDGGLNADSNILTVAGDFTTSGGLLGASCLSLDSSNTEYAEVADHADLDFANNRNAITLECWFKTSTNDAHQYLFDRRNGQDVFYMYIDHGNDTLRGRILTTGTTSELSSTTVVNDGKWHHVALVYDGDYSAHATIPAHKLYIDGKLEAEELSSGAIYSGTIPLRFGSKYSSEHFFNGEMDEIRMFAAAKTAEQIREDMFKAEGTNLTHFNSAADGSTDGLIGRWSCNAGTGSSLVSTGNTDVNAVIYDYNGGSPAAYTDAWAGAGTFDEGSSSTLVMTGTDKRWYMGSYNNQQVANFTVNGTITLQSIGYGYGAAYFTSGSSTFTLGASGTLSSHDEESLFFANANNTIDVSANTDGLANLFEVRFRHSSGNINLPEMTTKFVHLETSGGTVTSTGNNTLTTKLQVDSGTTFNANGNTIAAKEVDVNSGTLDLRNSTLNFSVTSDGDSIHLNGTSTLLSGNTNINGHGTTTRTGATFVDSAGFEVVGNVSNLNIQSDSDLTVIGSVTNCTFADSTANIRQWHHTLDTQQLLDADENGDDDLRLTKPALDNALELMTK